jgi:hypothetical protein
MVPDSTWLLDLAALLCVGPAKDVLLPAVNIQVHTADEH